MTYGNDAAYPTGEETKTGLVRGLTKREVMAKDFAAAYMNAAISVGARWDAERFANMGIMLADELIKQLNERDK